MNFTRDFVTKNAANWERWLGAFKDRPHTALEIGSFEGRSAIWFARNILTHADSRLICVDTFRWMDARPRFDANTTEAGVTERLDVRQQDSQLLELRPDILSWAYIDGRHEQQAVLMDAILVWRSLKPGGIVIFDDYLLDTNGSKQVKFAVDAFASVMGAGCEIVAMGGNQACVRKRFDSIR